MVHIIAFSQLSNPSYMITTVPTPFAETVRCSGRLKKNTIKLAIELRLFCHTFSTKSAIALSNPQNMISTLFIGTVSLVPMITLDLLTMQNNRDPVTGKR